MITLALDYPPTTNHYYRNVRGRMVISAKGRAYRNQVRVCVLEQLGQVEPLTGELSIRAAFNPPDNRRRDLDNVMGKALLDSLTHAGLWQDDSQVKRIEAEMLDAIPGGLCTVEVSHR
jgi:crossover junction endodeoxyribonuclease RusA